MRGHLDWHGSRKTCLSFACPGSRQARSVAQKVTRKQLILLMSNFSKLHHRFGGLRRIALPHACASTRPLCEANRVDLHPNLTQVRLVFASNVDPHIEHCPARERAGVRSDRRGHIKHHSTLASS